jgi:hypothetical protein
VAEAEAARRRGVHRTRMQATTAVALAVVLVAAGVGGLAWVRRPAPTPSDAPGTLPTVGKKISFGGSTDLAVPQIENPMINPTRTYVSWSNQDGTRVIAADLDDGHQLWQSAPVAAGYDVTTMIVISGAIVVTAAPGTGAGGHIWVLDPNSGKIWRQAPFDLSDEHVFYPNAMVGLDDATGVLSAVAWDTGRTLWQEPPGADRPARITGSATLLDQTNSFTFRNYGTSDRPVDSRLIEITRAGKILIRDAATGSVESTPPVTVHAQGRTYAYGDRLVTVSDVVPYRIQLTDLGTGAQSAWTGPAGRTFGQLVPCGAASVCVADDSGRAPQLALIDLARQRQVWRVAAAGDTLDFRDTLVVTGGSDPMVAYDVRTGRPVARAPQLSWLDDTRLIELPAATTAGGPVALIDDTGHRNDLGTIRIPAPSLCAWTTSRLVCTGRTGFQIYALNG